VWLTLQEKARVKPEKNCFPLEGRLGKSEYISGRLDKSEYTSGRLGKSEYISGRLAFFQCWRR